MHPKEEHYFNFSGDNEYTKLTNEKKGLTSFDIQFESDQQTLYQLMISEVLDQDMGFSLSVYSRKDGSHLYTIIYNAKSRRIKSHGTLSIEKTIVEEKIKNGDVFQWKLEHTETHNVISFCLNEKVLGRFELGKDKDERYALAI